MDLDLRPLGRPKLGYEKRFVEIYEMIMQKRIPKPTFLDKLLRRKIPTEEDLLQEMFDNQVDYSGLIRAPRVGRDREANNWIKKKYSESDKSVSESDLLKINDGFYVLDLAKESDGVPFYNAVPEDKSAFRAQYLLDCVDLIGEDLVCEAWDTKLADATLDYGQRLMTVADRIGNENNLQFLKNLRVPPNTDEDSIEFKLHVVYSLAKWLIFYGKNGHGYAADF